MCTAAIFGVCLCFVPDVDDFFDVLLGDRAEAAAADCVVELEVFLLRGLPVHKVDRVVVRLHVVVSLVLLGQGSCPWA